MNRRAPVALQQDGQHDLREDMLWGFPPFKPGAGYGTNFRTLKASQWRKWLDREHRCIVPATAFSEPDKNTPKGAVEWRWFERADKLPFFFAGIWRPWTGDRGTKKAPNIGDHMLFSIMTPSPTASFTPSTRRRGNDAEASTERSRCDATAGEEGDLIRHRERSQSDRDQALRRMRAVPKAVTIIATIAADHIGVMLNASIKIQPSTKEMAQRTKIAGSMCFVSSHATKSNVAWRERNIIRGAAN